MADTQGASIGWGGTIKLHNGTALYELKNIISFKPPPYNRTRVDTTHLKSPNRRPQSIPGLYESVEATGTMHYRAGSDTDVLMRSAAAAGNLRACEITIPLDGDADQIISVSAAVTSYEPQEVQAGEAMTATFTLYIEDAPTQADAP